MRHEPQRTAPAGGLLWRAAGDKSAQTRVTQAALCLTAHCMIARAFGGRLVEAAGVTDGGAGIPSTQRDGAGLVRGFGQVLRWRAACRVFLRRRRRRMAVPIQCSKAALDSFTRRSGVIAALGDDAGLSRANVDCRDVTPNDPRLTPTTPSPLARASNLPLNLIVEQGHL